ncbi:MAG: TldD/PmbA family protein [Candidatus Asgardarchaeia archaeon]
MIDFSKFIRKFDSLNVDFGDIREEETHSMGIELVNGSIRGISHVISHGISIRVLVNGVWGYASTTNLDTSEINDKIELAFKIAKVASERQNKKKLELKVKPIKERHKANVKVSPKDISLEEKISFLKDLENVQKNYDKRIVNTNSAYRESIRITQLANTYGSDLEWEEIRTSVFAVAFARENGKLQYSFNHESGTRGYELINSIDISDFGTKSPKEAIQLLSAKKPPAGNLIVIADPTVSGLLAHEVMGHASEADEVVKRRSFLTDAVGKKVASEYITMIDDGTIEGAYGSIPFDSEGTPAKRTVIIEKGIYKGYMHNLETATLLDAEPTGNGRAQDFNRRVWVRMRNTFFASGDWKLEEIIEDTKSGLLALKATSGMEDPVGGGFEGRTLMGYIIQNGELKDLVRGSTLTGNALEILKTVDAVSKDFILEGGHCGKGEEDWVPVTTGGAYIRGKMIVGGG